MGATVLSHHRTCRSAYGGFPAMSHRRGPDVVVFGRPFVDKRSEPPLAIPCYSRLGSHCDDSVVCFSQCSAYGNQQLLTSARIRPFPFRVLWPLLTSRRPFACHHAHLSPFATQCSCSDDETSADKHNHFHPIHPPHLRPTPRAVSDFALFGKLVQRVPPCM